MKPLHPRYCTKEELNHRRCETFKKTMARKSCQYYHWRNDVLERDYHRCVRCGSVGNIAHHLDGFASCSDLQFNVSNGVTLCKCCHSKFHLRFGNCNNTAIQFASFLLM